jgi:hypothetical protein
MLRLNRATTMRTSEAERQQVAEFLRDACAEGRLSPDELDGRLDALFASRTVADMDKLVWDLPGGRAVLPALWPTVRTPAPRPTRPPAIRPRVAVRAGVALVALAVLAVVFHSLPGFVAYSVLGIVVGLAVVTGLFAIALAPVGIVLVALAWIMGRLFRGRPPARGGRGYPFA